MISCLVLFHTKYMTASLRPYLLGQLQAFEHSKHDSPFNWICCYRRHQRHTIHSPDYSSTQQILTSRDSFLYRHHLPNHEYKFPPLNANYAVACCRSPAAKITLLQTQINQQNKKSKEKKTHPDHPRKKTQPATIAPSKKNRCKRRRESPPIKSPPFIPKRPQLRPPNHPIHPLCQLTRAFLPILARIMRFSVPGRHVLPKDPGECLLLGRWWRCVLFLIGVVVAIVLMVGVGRSSTSRILNNKNLRLRTGLFSQCRRRRENKIGVFGRSRRGRVEGLQEKTERLGMVGGEVFYPWVRFR